MEDRAFAVLLPADIPTAHGRRGTLLPVAAWRAMTRRLIDAGRDACAR